MEVGDPGYGMYAAGKFLDVNPWVGERRHEPILLARVPDNCRADALAAVEKRAIGGR